MDRRAAARREGSRSRQCGAGEGTRSTFGPLCARLARRRRRDLGLGPHRRSSLVVGLLARDRRHERRRRNAFGVARSHPSRGSRLGGEGDPRARRRGSTAIRERAPPAARGRKLALGTVARAGHTRSGRQGTAAVRFDDGRHGSEAHHRPGTARCAHPPAESGPLHRCPQARLRARAAPRGRGYRGADRRCG